MTPDKVLVSTLCPIIYHEHFLKEGLRQPAKGLVVGMDEILVPFLSTRKAEEKAVSETLLDILYADVCPPLERFNLGNQFGQAAKCLLHLSYTITGISLEGEEDDVA